MTTHDIYKTIGQRVKAQRAQAGMTLEELAEAAGISPSFLAYIEQGRKKLSVQTLWKVTQAMGLTLSQLMDAPAPDSAGKPAVSRQLDFLFRDKSAVEQKRLLQALRTLLKRADR